MVSSTQTRSLVTRGLKAPFNYYGGKGLMAPKLLPLVPAGGRPYCEPFCGAASLFFARTPAPVEVLNDLSGDLVNLFRVLQNRRHFKDFMHRVRHTLYSRAEFVRAIEVLKGHSADPVERAWAFFVAKNMGFGGMAKTAGNWGRTFCSYNGVAVTVNSWLMRLVCIPDWHRRLLCAQIDNRDALEVIQYWDNEDAVFYVDPPYVHATRASGSSGKYDCEMTDEQHNKLVDVVLACRGAVVLSGYRNSIYERLERAGWKTVDFQTACHAAGRGRGSPLRGLGSVLKHCARTETVWMNDRAVEMNCRSEGALL